MESLIEPVSLEKIVDQKVEARFLDYLTNGEPPCDYERQLMQAHFDRVMAIVEGELTPPYELEIQPSASCNLSCIHCLGRDYEPLEQIIDEEVMDIIAKRATEFNNEQFRIEVAKFCGTTGEPLVNRATAYGIKMFKDQGFKVIVFTNGLLLESKTGDGTETFIDAIQSADKLNLSLDAGSEEVFREIKGKTGFDRIIRSLAAASEKDNAPYIVASYVIGIKNYQDILNAAKKVSEAGANEIRYRVDFTNIGEVHNISSTILAMLEQAKQYTSPTFKVNSVYSTGTIRTDDSEFHSTECFNHNFWACIGPDANLYTCGHRTHGNVLSFGSLLDHSFRELWHSPDRERQVRSLPDNMCINCSPSSSRRNQFMTWLSKIPVDSVRYLHDKYIANAIKLI